MSDHLYHFGVAEQGTAVALPFSLERFADDWSRLRSRMVRDIPTEFSRDEWAYLVAFLDKEALLDTFCQAFGEPMTAGSGRPKLLARPRGQVAVWLPGNVSLLGPLVLVLLSLTGNSIRLKGATEADDLAGVFLRYAREHSDPGELSTYLSNQVHHEVFARTDLRSREMAQESQVRIVFGSDAAAEAIHAMPHPMGSKGFSFIDRRSEAWIEKACVTDEMLRDLIKVFAIYGQAGCTSPRRVVLLDASPREAAELSDRLVAIWTETVEAEPAMHIASSCIMGGQLAAALGWGVMLPPRHGAVFATGDLSLPECPAPMGLMVVAASVEEARAALPENIQTIGHAFTDPGDPLWLRAIADTAVKRLVPLQAMHHFGPVWDGEEFWRGCFEFVPVG